LHSHFASAHRGAYSSPVSWESGCSILRIQPIVSASQAETYYATSDGGYYDKPDELRSAWLGRGAELLGLDGPPDFEHFKRLIHGLDPATGEQLTAKLLDNRLAGWDVNVHCPKGVTLVIEHGDSRVQDALWDATRETVADLERFATTRIRKGGKQDDRLTGNLVAYAVEHAETRPAKDDRMPDPHRHIHVVVMNVTYDKAEHEWKAVKFRPIMDLRKYFDRRFNQRLSHKLTELGYTVESKWKHGPRGERKYMGWDVTGIPASGIRKFSRRTAEIDKLAEELGVIDPVAKDKLGATSRQPKRHDLSLDDYRRYWHGKFTPREAQQIERTIGDARDGLNPRPEPLAAPAMQFAIDHHFERQSVVPLTTLEVTAMEKSMGASLPEEIEREARRQELLIRDGQATTKEVLAEEARIIGIARDGRGAWKPLGTNTLVRGFDSLSAEQQAAVRHVWRSPDAVILIRGGAGTGKTTMMQAAVAGIDRSVVVLAPSADASRDVLRNAGFPDADTIARFLASTPFRETARDGVIWIDEAGLAGIRQLDQVFGAANELGARVVLQGDGRQHKSVERGSPLQVLEELAGLPVARLTDIRRQQGRYKEAVAAIDRGDILAGHDLLAGLGWIKQTGPFDQNHPLVDDYLAAVDAKTSVMIIAPTHAEGSEITQVIRSRLKDRGVVANDERTLLTLVPLHWTEAERSDFDRYSGEEVVQFHRNSGPFKARERVSATRLIEAGDAVDSRHFSVYGTSDIQLAAGDAVRITSNGKTLDGRHKVNNGTFYRIDGFTPGGNIRLHNGWVLHEDFGHLSYGYVSTSHASQGKSFQQVLVAMGQESVPAINAEQFYVSVSRGREMAKIYTDISAATLREHIRRSDRRMTAHELLSRGRPVRRFRDWPAVFTNRVQRTFSQLREKAREAMKPMIKEREMEYAR